MVGIASAFLYAILTNRAFQIGEHRALLSFDRAFTTSAYCHINWTRRLDPVWLTEPLKENAVAKQYNHSILKAGEYFAVNTIGNEPLLEYYLKNNINALLGGKASTTLFCSNRGRTIRLFENPFHRDQLHRLALNQHNAFCLVINSLFQPRARIFLPVYDEFRRLTHPDPSILKIAIHIRVGDHALSNPDYPVNLSTYYQYFTCAEQIANFVKAGQSFRASTNFSKVLWYTEILPPLPPLLSLLISFLFLPASLLRSSVSRPLRSSLGTWSVTPCLCEMLL